MDNTEESHKQNFGDEFFPEPHGVSQDHNEDQLIKDGNALIQQDLETRKNKRESYARSQALNRKLDKNKFISLSSVDWSGFPAAAHSPGKASERKRIGRISGLDSKKDDRKDIKRPLS